MWIDQTTTQYFGQQFAQRGALVMESVPLPRPHFRSESEDVAANIALVNQGDENILVLVSLGLQPRTPEATQVLEAAQRVEDSEGNPWLLIGTANSFEEALEVAGQRLYLGVAGQAPDEQDRHERIDSPAERNGEPVVVPGADNDELRNRRGDRALGELRPFGRELTALARAGELTSVVGRDQELLRITAVLLKATKNSPCLVGEAGVGKTAIVEGFAVRVVQGEVPDRLRNAQVFELDMAAIVAGAAHKGAVEERLKRILGAVAAQRKQSPVVLFLDEIHLITEARGDVTVAEILKPHLARGLQMIGATTHADWKRAIEPDKALVRRLEPVLVVEPDGEQVLEILRHRLPRLTKHHGVAVTDDLLQDIVALSNDYLPERSQPDKALDLLDEAMAVQATRTEADSLDSEVTS